MPSMYDWISSPALVFSFVSVIYLSFLLLDLQEKTGHDQKLFRRLVSSLKEMVIKKMAL